MPETGRKCLRERGKGGYRRAWPKGVGGGRKGKGGKVERLF